MNSINSSAIQKFPCTGVAFVRPFYTVVDQYRKMALVDREQLAKMYYMRAAFFISWAREGVAATAIAFECDDTIRKIMYDATARYYFSVEAIRDYCIFSREHTMSCNYLGYTNERARRYRPNEKYNFMRDLPIYNEYMLSRRQSILDDTSKPMYNYMLQARVTERFFEVLAYMMSYCQQDNPYDEDALQKSEEIMDMQEAMGLRIAHSTVLGPAPSMPARRGYARATKL